MNSIHSLFSSFSRLIGVSSSRLVSPKRFGLVAILILLQYTFTLHAQLTSEQLGGVYYAYPTPKQVMTDVAPEGYRLVYVSHYGRHGSRWVTSDKRYEWVLSQFDDEHNLTSAGRKAKKLLTKICAHAKGNGGQLTPLGARQHQGIAERMKVRFPSLFTSQTELKAYSSVVPRCRKSMEAFLSKMTSDHTPTRPQGGGSANSKGQLSQTRDYASPSSLGEGKGWVVVCDSSIMRWIAYDSPDEQLLKQEPSVPLGIAVNHFIVHLFKDTTKVNEPEKLFSEMFTIASDMQDVPELGISLYGFFTDEEMRACYRQSCRNMWHQNGLDPTNHDIPSQCVASLWINIVAEADSALHGHQPAITLRFGHDTALYRLLSLLRSKTLIDGQGDNLFDIVPMAANLQMAFYQNDDDSVLVAFWLNERPMQLGGISAILPATAQHPACYSWTALKQHLQHYLDRQQWMDRTSAINTFVGTDYAVTASVGRYGKGSEEHGQTLPAVLAPHGMTFWTPQTRDTELKCIAPYYYPDTLLQGFRASHWIVGGCTQDYGSFTLMPMMGRLRLKPVAWATRFTHNEEISHPYYYAVNLPDEHLMAEMTGTSHTAIFRFTAQDDDTMHIAVMPNNDEQEGFITVDTIRNCVWGRNPVHRIYQGWGERAGFSGWFVVQFQRPIKLSGVKDTVAYVSFPVKKGEQVLARAATSFTGIDGAWRNLQAEMPSWDFLGARISLDSLWQQQLSTINVDDSNVANINTFYDALYRTAFLPHVLSDVDGRHPRFASPTSLGEGLGEVAEASAPYYGDYSMWDIYRAELPLLTLTDTSRMRDIMQSLVTKYEEGGWMPIFPCWNSYTAAMIGDHAVAAIADAWVKGIRGFDIRKAYEGLRKNAFESPASYQEYKDGMGRRALKSYLRYGYIPLEDSVAEAFHTREQVSRTLEYAYDDYCLAQLAHQLGYQKDEQQLLRRSQNWRNVINPKTGWADGRHANGRWLGNRDLTGRMPFITEGSVMHYSFYVPHDVYGLMQAMGGRSRFIEKLDTLFNGGYYWHGNEPCHHMAYLYAWAGEPWKTQRLVHTILQTEYKDVPGGLSGNDDAGQMSAWQVFSMMGFYPVCPGTPDYILGTPTFHHLRLGAFELSAENLSDNNIYIQRATWDGRPYTRNYITHDMLRQGGHLVLYMGSQPNKQWGSQPEDCPPAPVLHQRQ